MSIRKLMLLISAMLVMLTGVFSIVSASDNGQEIKSAGAKVKIISEGATNIYAAGASVTIEGIAKQDIWAAGALVNIDAETFEIRDGKLYLFYNSWGNNTLDRWLKENPALLKKEADANWEKINQSK